MFYVLAATARASARVRARSRRGPSESRVAARSRRARYRRRRGAARSRPTASSSSRACARIRARTRASRRLRACSRRRARPARATATRPRLRRRSAPQRRRPARRHVDRHPLPARRRRRRGAALARASSTGSIASGATSKRRCRTRRSPISTRCRRARRTTRTRSACYRADVASGRRRHRRLAAQGPRSIVRRSSSRAGSDGELKGSGRSIAGFHLRDALDLVTKREPGLDRAVRRPRLRRRPLDREAALPRFAAAFEARGARGADAGGPEPHRRNATARSRRASSRFALAESLRDAGVGPGIPAADVRRRVRRRRLQRVVGDAHTATGRSTRGGERFGAILFRPTASRSRRGSAPCSVPRSTAGNGKESLRARDRALAARRRGVTEADECERRAQAGGSRGRAAIRCAIGDKPTAPWRIHRRRHAISLFYIAISALTQQRAPFRSNLPHPCAAHNNCVRLRRFSRLSPDRPAETRAAAHETGVHSCV